MSNETDTYAEMEIALELVRQAIERDTNTTITPTKERTMSNETDGQEMYAEMEIAMEVVGQAIERGFPRAGIPQAVALAQYLNPPGASPSVALRMALDYFVPMMQATPDQLAALRKKLAEEFAEFEVMHP